MSTRGPPFARDRMLKFAPMRSESRIRIAPAQNLYGLSRMEIARCLGGFGAPAYHADQVFQWIYGRGVFDPDRWTDLPRALRSQLAASARVSPGHLEERTVAADRTVKYGVHLAGGGRVEAVAMVDRERVTLCISSQVGCALDCDFCLTGKMGLVRHLSPGEIAGQVALMREEGHVGDRPCNVVFMGMGEPLHNYDAVIAAFRLLTDPRGFGLSRRRITVSTSGLAPAIERLAREPAGPRLAVSLNATTDEVRSRLMPVNSKYPIARLLAACRAFATATGDRLTFEYVLLEGVNDHDADVSRLARLLRSFPAKLNLIPFNPVPGWIFYSPTTKERVLAIRDHLLAMRVPVSIRWSRGREARAACGQLALLPEAPAPVKEGPP